MAAATHDLDELKRRMQGAIQVLKQELGGLRTGRARASLVDHVQVDAYGTHMPLNQVATVSVPEPRLITVQVWDRSMVHAVEKAITAANLGLTPQTEGQVIRLRIPELNAGAAQGARQGRAQICRGRAGRGAPCAPRRHRRAQEDGKGPQISEDEHKRHAEVQKATDQAITDIDQRSPPRKKRS